LFYAPKIFFHAPVAKFLYFFVLFSGYNARANRTQSSSLVLLRCSRVSPVVKSLLRFSRRTCSYARELVL